MLCVGSAESYLKLCRLYSVCCFRLLLVFYGGVFFSRANLFFFLWVLCCLFSLGCYAFGSQYQCK